MMYVMLVIGLHVPNQTELYQFGHVQWVWVWDGVIMVMD